MRKPLIAGNWKLFKTIPEALQLVEGLKQRLADIEDADIVVAPVFTALASVSDCLRGSNIAVAAQNCYPENSGAFTGEVSPALIKDAGCTYCIIGHSERRQLFHEQDDFINLKVHASLASGLQVILCVGETLEEREQGQMFEVLTNQLQGSLKNVSAEQMNQVIIAYEPVWAIGTGKTATATQAAEAHAFIRGVLMGDYDPTIAHATRILYGGSVKPNNVDELMAEDDIDGTLVGGASLLLDDFDRIAHFARKS